MKSDKLISRIKKLMAMAADGSSPQEAMIAARRARKMMDDNQISIEDLQERSAFSTTSASDARRFTPNWENILSVAIAQYNDCIASLSYCTEKCGYRLTFKGFDEDVKVAEYMFYYLVENGKRQCSKFMRDNGHRRYNARIGTSFKDAYAVEICMKIRQLVNERQKEASVGKGLMVIKKQLVAEHFGVVEYKHTKRARNLQVEDLTAHRAGSYAGKKTPIHTGLDQDTRESIK